MHTSKLRALMGAAALALAVGGSAWAAGDGDHDHDKESNDAKYRHAVMEALGEQFTAFTMVYTNRVARPDNLQPHADALAATAKTIGSLFPPGSEGGHALPLIWEEPDKVAEAAKEAASAAEALASAVSGGNKGEIAQAFKAAGQSCKGCHQRYKEEDD